MFVNHIQSTPLKGTRLHTLWRSAVSEHGLVDDRLFHLVDDDGRLVNGRRYGPLVRLQATYDRDRDELGVAVPGRGVVTGRADRLGEAVSTRFFDHDVQGRLLHGPWAAALSAYAGRGLHVVRVVRPSFGVDKHPVTLVSAATLDWVRLRLGAPPCIDRRAARMSIEIGGCRPREEETWVGRDLRIGDAVVHIVGLVPRCVVTQQDPATGAHSWNTMRALLDGRPPPPDGTPHKPLLGVHAVVVTPGTVVVGAPVDDPTDPQENPR
ncbi:MOSC domain-containing protein [Pseudonocardia sp. N23]|uniref:MOSC domain-containing protein n=1 Tax=Pseudonocardia sp. N23 TaxID=1987376 RepID=UPI000C02BC5B|nr:MOSC N-terminal beta barrel domain-containing protein [Pseudonocardia sp. N23]GAY10881.1 hypothetical protein TOK_5365 [Pseudonocardia sp. N23]